MIRISCFDEAGRGVVPEQPPRELAALTIETGAPLSTIQAFTLCAALVAVDFIARTWRMQAFLRGIWHRVSFREVLLQSLVCEAGSILTPMRIGGDPARLWAMRQGGVSMTASVVCMGVEAFLVAAVIVVVTAVLMLSVAGDWWGVVGPGLLSALTNVWQLALLAIAFIAGWIVTRHYAPKFREMVQREARSVRRYARVMPRWTFVLAVPLTLIHMGARVAVLPVLASTLEVPPPLLASAIGSYALLYGQLLAPTPAGAGAVELGFVGGAAGELGVEEGSLLVAWRVITAGIPLLLGVAAAVLHYGFRLFGPPDVVERGRRA